MASADCTLCGGHTAARRIAARVIDGELPDLDRVPRVYTRPVAGLWRPICLGCWRTVVCAAVSWRHGQRAGEDARRWIELRNVLEENRRLEHERVRRLRIARRGRQLLRWLT